MLVVCAPDSFKESVSAGIAAGAMAAGARRAAPTITVDACPVADGGEGTLETLVAARGGAIETVTVTGPTGTPVAAPLGLLPGDGVHARIGVVELAAASGLALVPTDARNPERTTTIGTGQLIAAARERGCGLVIVTLGGSGTCDGGAGIAQALGARFLDASGREIRDHLTGGRLREIASCTPAPDLPELRVACDVTNPLLGPEGSAVVYAPQKGATPEQVVRLERALAHFARVAGPAHAGRPGAGAAGGAAFGLIALCGATLERGADLVLDAIDFDERVRNAALVLTGEGRLDAQSLSGKACVTVARRARALAVPTIAIVGDDAADAAEARNEFHTVLSLTTRAGRARAMTETATLLADAAEEAVRAFAEGSFGC